VTRRQGLAPVGEGKPRIGALCLAERLGRPIVFETVKQCDSEKKSGLSGCRSRIGEDDFSESCRVPFVLGQGDRRNELARSEGGSHEEYQGSESH